MGMAEAQDFLDGKLRGFMRDDPDVPDTLPVTFSTKVVWYFVRWRLVSVKEITAHINLKSVDSSSREWIKERIQARILEILTDSAIREIKIRLHFIT